MAQTKDPTQGTIELEEEDAPTAVGQIRLNSGNILAQDSVGVFNLRSAGGGLDATTHRALDQLVHDVAENSYTEVERTGSRVDALRIYTDSSKTTKIREEEYSYTLGKVVTIVTKQYDGGGSLVETYTETISYTGANIDSIVGALI